MHHISLILFVLFGLVSSALAQKKIDTTRINPKQTLYFLNALAQRPTGFLPKNQSAVPTAERMSAEPTIPAQPRSEEDGGKGAKRKWSSISKGKAIQPEPSNRLFSQATLNRYMANQTVRYLTGKEDVSYYDNYFTASSADNSLTFGKTSTCKDDSERIVSVWNYGLKTKVLTGLGNLFSGRQFTHEVGLYSNFTLFGRGSIWYDETKADSMQHERAYILQTIAVNQKQETDQYSRNETDAFNAFLLRLKPTDIK